MFETYMELYQLYQVYPRECRRVVYMILFHQLMFLWLNLVLIGTAPFLLILFLDVSWQAFLNVYTTNELHFVWIKNAVEEPEREQEQEKQPEAEREQ